MYTWVAFVFQSTQTTLETTPTGMLCEPPLLGFSVIQYIHSAAELDPEDITLCWNSNPTNVFHAIRPKTLVDVCCFFAVLSYPPLYRQWASGIVTCPRACLPRTLLVSGLVGFQLAGLDLIHQCPHKSDAQESINITSSYALHFRTLNNLLSLAERYLILRLVSRLLMLPIPPALRIRDPAFDVLLCKHLVLPPRIHRKPQLVSPVFQTAACHG